ncbi:MAG: hypothetical protein DMF55_08595 [Acidobacteria bacterium]|nr:MAG: hypothetical protein DMF55_08595 [Acidobacteriota bacterium]
MRLAARILLAGSLAAGEVFAQTAEKPATEPARPPEGSRIINLPSTEVPAGGTLGVLFVHRFKTPLGDSNARNLFSLDSGADDDFGVSYSPWNDLEVSLDRSSIEADYELAFKYRFLAMAPGRPIALALRVGGDADTKQDIEDRQAVFAQGIASLALGSRARITVVPTYVSNTSRFRNVFNVPMAVSLAITRSVNFQGEFVPKNRDYGASSYGWIVAFEKTVLRHRFSWTFGNLRTTTVDQYSASDPAGGRLSRRDVYMGFNIVRQWKLK